MREDLKNKTINRFYKIGKPHIKKFILIVVLAIIVDVLAAYRPVLIKTIIDEFMQNKVNIRNLKILNKK